MNAIHSSQRTAIRFKPDRIGRIHFRVDGGSGASCFSQAQLRFLSGAFADESAVFRLACGLMMFDGVVDPADLIPAVQSCALAYRWNGGVAIEWVRPDGRQDRRILSPMTVRALSEITDTITADSIKGVMQSMSEKLYGHRYDPGLVFSDAQSWAHQHLGGALLAHVLNLGGGTSAGTHKVCLSYLGRDRAADGETREWIQDADPILSSHR